ncbi:MAG: hypothetical protein ACJ8G5_06455 [Burkholderiales bacterium]
MSPRERRLELAAASALGLMLTVVVAAAGIRLEIGFPGLRVLHRVVASLEVLAVLWLAWMAWRTRAERPGVFGAALLAIGLTAFLALVGIAAGQKPQPAGAAANLLGGLALATLFAWILGKAGEKWGQTPSSRRSPECSRKGSDPIFLLIGALMAIQLALGARLTIAERFSPALPVHALLAMVLAALLAWFALTHMRGAAGKALFALALAAPIAGFTALHYEWSACAALVHAAAAALLLVSTAYALGRVA